MVCLKVFYSAPHRHILTCVACIGTTLAFCMREVLVITIIEMTEPHEEPIDEMCHISSGKDRPVLAKDFGEKLKWTEMQQALILMGFYIGYALSHFMAGPLISKCGTRWPLIFGMSISAVTTALIPIFVNNHWSAVMTIRLFTGIGQSVLFPGISSLLTYWIPLETRSTIAAIIYVGVPMGTFLGIYISAVVVIYYENWHYPYYMWSILTAFWLIFFLIYIYSYPETHPRITAAESSYRHPSFIKKDQMETVLEGFIFCSQFVATFGHTYILYTLSTYLPKYLNTILKYEMEDYSVYAATPFALMYLSGIISRTLCNNLVKKKNINPDLLRVFNVAICNILSGGALVGAFYVTCDHYSTIIGLIHLAALLGGFFYGGLNMLDFSLRRSELVTSLVNGFACTSAVAAISVIATMVRKNSNKEWQKVVWILFILEVFLWLVDITFVIIRLFLVEKKYPSERRWFENIPQEEHRAKMVESKEIQRALKEKQKGQTDPGISKA